jgi:hypothetical protein
MALKPESVPVGDAYARTVLDGTIVVTTIRPTER